MHIHINTQTHKHMYVPAPINTKPISPISGYYYQGKRVHILHGTQTIQPNNTCAHILIPAHSIAHTQTHIHTLTHAYTHSHTHTHSFPLVGITIRAHVSQFYAEALNKHSEKQPGMGILLPSDENPSDHYKICDNVRLDY